MRRDADPLLRFIELNFIAAAVSTVVVVFAYVAWVRSGWVVVILMMVIAVAAGLAVARRDARAGRRASAVGWVASVNMAGAVIAVALVPDVLAPMVLVVLLQIVLAADDLSHEQFVMVVTAAFLTVVVATAASRVGGPVSLLDEIPGWLLDVAVVVAIPVVASLVTMLMWRHRASLAYQADEVRRSRSRLAGAADEERRRLERNLHDGAQQQLIAATIRIPTVQALLDQQRTAEAAHAVAGIEQALRYSIEDLRRLGRGLYPPVLAARGLTHALGEALTTVPNPVVNRLGAVPRLPPERETAVYYCCLEALQNASKHASGEQVTVTLMVDGHGDVSFAVADDGPGFDTTLVRDGSGLTNMEDRIVSVGGHLAVSSHPGGGTVISGSMPIGHD